MLSTQGMSCCVWLTQNCHPICSISLSGALCASTWNVSGDGILSAFMYVIFDLWGVSVGFSNIGVVNSEGVSIYGGVVLSDIAFEGDVVWAMTLEGVTLYCGIRIRVSVVYAATTRWASIPLAMSGWTWYSHRCLQVQWYDVPSDVLARYDLSWSLWMTVPGIQRFLNMSNIEIRYPA